MDGPLDFESEDPLLPSPTISKRRKKVIGLDDLLNDHYKEKSRHIERESKRAKAQQCYSSDEDEDFREAELFDRVSKCQDQMCQMSGEDETSLWGLQVFGCQKTVSPLVFPELRNSVLLQTFVNHELNSLVELNAERGETFLGGLLVDGWLFKLVCTCGYVEKSIATWTFNLLLYSSKEMLRTSACDFWCDILSYENEGDLLCPKIEWLPSYTELKRALEIYGFQLDSPSKSSCNMEMVNADSDCGGPPQNIRAWIKFVAACCQARNTHSIFSNSDAEELVGMIICLFLDRQLLGLSIILSECLLSVIIFFTVDEWNASCEKVAKSLACRVPIDINCLRTVDSISGVDARSKQLRSAVAFQFLIACFANKDMDAEEILSLLISINVKHKSCDLSKMYIYICLTENWLLNNPMLKNKTVIYEMWGVYLRNCSCKITSTDLRSYASKVRSKASYLLQGTTIKEV